MKNIIMAALITGLTGCQGFLPLTADKLSELSNEDLCCALGTYNHNGRLVLSIYDELQKRPEKIDAERCLDLERANKTPKDNMLNKHNNFNHGGVTPPYIMHMNSHRDELLNIHSQTSNNNMNQNIDPQHHKIITNPRKNNKPDTEELDLFKLNTRIHEYKTIPDARDSFYLNTKDIVTDKINMKEKEMDKLMKDCLRKNISRR